jgi:thiamine pyrophosphokinase
MGMHALVFLWQPAESPVRELPPHDLVIAADSGLETAEKWGVTPDVAIGDFDSTSMLTHAEKSGVMTHQVPKEKDETDAELAIAAALDRGATEITVIASGYGRVDHALAILLGLGVENLAQCDVSAWIDDTLVFAVRHSIDLDASNGRRVSLIPLYGNVCGVSTHNLKWSLVNATLKVGSAFAVSNEFDSQADRAKVTVTSGTLLVMQSRL